MIAGCPVELTDHIQMITYAGTQPGGTPLRAETLAGAQAGDVWVVPA
jgi:hypothetical protein